MSSPPPTYPMVTMYMGKKLEDMTHEELLVASNHFAKELFFVRGELNKLRPHVDWVSYLKAG